MSGSTISAKDPYERQRVAALDTEMAYIEVGAGDNMRLFPPFFAQCGSDFPTLSELFLSCSQF